MVKVHPAVLSLGLAMVVLCTAMPSAAQWSAQPGETVRNVFGPQAGTRAAQCRGACGADCPDTCTQQVAYECFDSSRLRRVVTYACGTHEGCREHDDCLDACIQKRASGGDCQKECDAQAMERFGLSSASWLLGGGPYDGRISFEYTRDAPDSPEPAYRCPDGSSRQCSSGGCLMPDGSSVEPVFDSFPGAGDDAMRISGFSAGPACGNRVCARSSSIPLTGADSCPRGPCTRYGVEFDYRNADPSAPLECSTSSRGGDKDFVGDLLKLGADASSSRGVGTSGGQEEDGMGALLGVFQKVLTSADSPEDVNVSMAPLGADGKPIESQRVGSETAEGPPPVPSSIELPAASGHLFIPMYHMAAGAKEGNVVARRVRCTHKGAPVVETTFYLRQ